MLSSTVSASVFSMFGLNHLKIANLVTLEFQLTQTVFFGKRYLSAIILSRKLATNISSSFGCFSITSFINKNKSFVSVSIYSINPLEDTEHLGAAGSFSCKYFFNSKVEAFSISGNTYLSKFTTCVADPQLIVTKSSGKIQGTSTVRSFPKESTSFVLHFKV